MGSSERGRGTIVAMGATKLKAGVACTSVEAAASLVPEPVREHLELGDRGRLAGWRQARIRMLGRAAEFAELPISPRAQARKRVAASRPS